jgi:hypothetical protein
MGFAGNLGASARYQTLGRSGGGGTQITASATANTKGSYATLGTTGFDYDGFWVTITSVVSGTTYRQRVDLAVNTGGSDQVVAEDVYYDGSITGEWYDNSGAGFFVPVKIPGGAVVKARCQSSTGSGTLLVSINGMQGDARLVSGFRALKSATDWTNTDPTNSLTLGGTTLSGWTQVMASTPVRFAGLYLGLDSLGAAPGFVSCFFDIGWGIAGSEQVLTTVGTASFGGGGPSPLFYHPIGPFPCDLPAGTRLAVRGQSAYSGAAGTVYPVLHGLAA